MMDFDGCSSKCTLETMSGGGTGGTGSGGTSGGSSGGSGGAPVGMMCGHGVVDAGEQCDDGNMTEADGCSIACTIEQGWSCPAPGKPCY